MDYKLGDILECIEIVSTDVRVIDNGDCYRVVDMDFVTEKNIYITQIKKNKNITYHGCIPISIEYADKYFKCQRVERKRKLEKLNVK